MATRPQGHGAATPPPVRLSIYVQPGAAKTERAGLHGDAIKIRVAARPLENAANLALVEFVAAVLGVPKRQVRVIAGASSRRKVIEIDGVSAARAAAALGGTDNAR